MRAMLRVLSRPKGREGHVKIPEKLGSRLVPILNGASAVSGIFAVIMAAFVLVTAARLAAIDPLASTALAGLKQELSVRPADAALSGEIRSLDLTARTAYFTARRRIDLGAVILAAAFAIFAASLRAASWLSKRIPDPKSTARVPLSRSHALELRALAAAAIGLFAVISAAALLSTRDLSADFRRILNTAGLGGYPSRTSLMANWPAFRGPASGGVPPEARGAAGFGREELAVLWRIPAGLPGTGSPVVWDNGVFVCGASSEAQEISRFDADTGQEVWRVSTRELLGKDQPSPEVSRDTGWAAPTPACDGKRLFVMFASGRLLALSLQGQLLWSRDFGIPENPYGIASSIALFRDEVIVQFDQSNMSLVAAFQAGSGRLLWRRSRKLRPSWATPVVVDEPEWKGLIVVGNPTVEALDLETGQPLWAVDCMSGETAPSAAYSDGRAFAVTALASAFAISCLPGGDLKPGDILWSYEEDLPDTSSPLAAGGRLYLASSAGVVTCLDARSGRPLWRHEYEARVPSSPINVGGVVFLADASGLLHRFEDSPVYSPLADIQLGGPVAATPAFHDGRLYVRAGDALVCIGRR